MDDGADDRVYRYKHIDGDMRDIHQWFWGGGGGGVCEKFYYICLRVVKLCQQSIHSIQCFELYIF